MYDTGGHYISRSLFTELQPYQLEVVKIGTENNVFYAQIALWSLLGLCFILFCLMIVYMSLKTRIYRQIVPAHMSRAVHPGRVRRMPSRRQSNTTDSESKMLIS